MLGHRFTPGTQKLETTPRGFFSIPTSKRKSAISLIFFIHPLTMIHDQLFNVVSTQTENLLL